jgi:TonB family protein
MVKPAYPESEQAAGIQGYVVMEARIGTDGRLASLKVLNSVDPALDQAAIAAVQQWQYEPTLLNGRPVEVTTSITVNFKLP